jgi:hypothetical protein
MMRNGNFAGSRPPLASAIHRVANDLSRIMRLNCVNVLKMLCPACTHRVQTPGGISARQPRFSTKILTNQG